MEYVTVDAPPSERRLTNFEKAQIRRAEKTSKMTNQKRARLEQLEMTQDHPIDQQVKSNPDDQNPDHLTNREKARLKRLERIRECPVCLESKDKKEFHTFEVVDNSCGHCVCCSCIVQIKSHGNDTLVTCPMCRIKHTTKGVRGINALKRHH